MSDLKTALVDYRAAKRRYEQADRAVIEADAARLQAEKDGEKARAAIGEAAELNGATKNFIVGGTAYQVAPGRNGPSIILADCEVL